MEYRPRCDEQEVREAVAAAHSASEALRLLGLRPAGGNHSSLRRWIAHFAISTDHFDLDQASRQAVANRTLPLERVLTRNSTYSRGSLKRRLYAAGLKERRCELCGQGEQWHGRVMSLILDHINGDASDNRLENLRIVCANCNATLDTHCGRQGRVMWPSRTCLYCDDTFVPRFEAQKYCSRACGVHSRDPRVAKPEIRKVERPPYEQLMAELAASNYSAVGRCYGVSDNAVRKWVRWYEAVAERREAA